MFVASEARVGRLAPCLIHALPEAGAERIHRVAEIGPARRQVSAARGAKGAAFGLPARGRRLGGEDLVGVHAFEEIIAAVEFADMVETQPAPGRRTVGRAVGGGGRAKFAGLAAARNGASGFARNAAVKTMGSGACHAVLSSPTWGHERKRSSATRDGRAALDRKSTRLNSSH